MRKLICSCHEFNSNVKLTHSDDYIIKVHYYTLSTFRDVEFKLKFFFFFFLILVVKNDFKIKFIKILYVHFMMIQQKRIKVQPMMLRWAGEKKKDGGRGIV